MRCRMMYREGVLRWLGWQIHANAPEGLRVFGGGPVGGEGGLERQLSHNKLRHLRQTPDPIPL